MSNFPKLALFDVDGTIAEKSKIPQEIIDGLAHLQQNGCITSISTGRGYIRIKDMLGDDFDKIISPDALIILEHGTKIVNRQGEVVFGEYFSETEIDHVIDFIRANIEIFRLVWFNPDDVSKKVQFWCIDEREVQSEAEKRRAYADVFVSTIGELKERLLQHKLTNVSVKLKDYVKVENLKLAFTRTETNVIFQDGNMEFVRNNTNKGLSVLYVAKKLGVNLDDLLIAGNAINDVEMLDIGAGKSILVSTGDNRSNILAYLSEPDSIIKVNSPKDLGNYLSDI